MSKKVLELHYQLSDEIRANYAKRNEDPKYLKAAIEACEKQISIAAEVAGLMLAGEKRYTLKTDEEIIAQFKEEMAEDLDIVAGGKN